MSTLRTRATALALAVTPLLALATAGAAPAHAQALNAVMPTTLVLAVEGVVTRAPDVAEVSGGVVTIAPTAGTAMTDNAAAMNRVIAAIRKAGIAERDIQTRGIGLQPQYRYDNGKAPVLTGYQASNTVSLRIRRLAEAGKTLDALVAAGVNQIDGPNFRLEDDASALDAARVAALKTARERAVLYAGAAGLAVKRIVSISESSDEMPSPRPMAMAMRAESADAPTPVAPGELALRINLSVTFELQ
jgi:hypothetical protein